MVTSTETDAHLNRTGLLLVGHGTRNRQGRLEFLQTAEMVAERLAGIEVAACFLELAEPDIATGVAQLAAADVQSLVIAPLLLFAAGHARRDIPAAVEAAAGQYNGLGLRQCDALDCHEAMLKLSAERFDEALQGHASVPAGETALLLVGRGSRDDSATAAMLRFGALCAQRAPVANVEVSFMAMAEPSISDGISKLAESEARRIVVQPHLLFQGDLLDRLEREIAAARQSYPDQQWLVAPHLGPSPLLVDAIVGRYREAT